MKRLLLIFVSMVFIFSCNNFMDEAKNEKENPGTIDFEIEALYMPKAITGYSANPGSRDISNFNVADWKSFYIVPQIGNNYNSWVEESVLPKVTELSKEVDSMDIIENDKYSLRWEYFSGNELKELFMTTEDFSSWTYIVRTGGEEIRQLLFTKEGDKKHILALFFRKNEDDMNDIVEIIETKDSITTKCVRTYDISTEAQLFLNFASITNLQGESEETTGVLLTKENSGAITLDSLFSEQDLLNDLSPASPAVFNSEAFLIEENALTGYDEYPDKDEVLNVVFNGINNMDVAEVDINPETFVSTLAFSEYSKTISTFTKWSELDNSNSQSSLEIIGDWGYFEQVPQTFMNFNSIKKQSSYEIPSYINGDLPMDELVGDSTYSKEIYSETGKYRFQANSDFTKWRYTKNNSGEIRQLVYLKDDSVTPAVEYYYALFYRVDIDDMNDLVVIKTSEDIVTYGASMRVYNISSTPSYYNTFFTQDLLSETGNGTAITDPNSENFTYFNKNGVVEEDTTVVQKGFPDLEKLKDFGNSIPYLNQLDSITIDSADLNGGLSLSNPF